MSLHLFLSSCFHAVKDKQLEPTKILFKWSSDKLMSDLRRCNNASAFALVLRIPSLSRVFKINARLFHWKLHNQKKWRKFKTIWNSISVSSWHIQCVTYWRPFISSLLQLFGCHFSRSMPFLHVRTHYSTSQLSKKKAGKYENWNNT